MQDSLEYLEVRPGRVELSRKTTLKLSLQRRERLKLWDLASLAQWQPLFVKFWQLFLQLQSPLKSTSAPLQTLPSALYQEAIGLVHKALGQQSFQVSPTTEASYTRFCYDFTQALTSRFPTNSLEE